MLNTVASCIPFWDNIVPNATESEPSKKEEKYSIIQRLIYNHTYLVLVFEFFSELEIKKIATVCELWHHKYKILEIDRCCWKSFTQREFGVFISAQTILKQKSWRATFRTLLDKADNKNEKKTDAVSR